MLYTANVNANANANANATTRVATSAASWSFDALRCSELRHTGRWPGFYYISIICYIICYITFPIICLLY